MCETKERGKKREEDREPQCGPTRAADQALADFRLGADRRVEEGGRVLHGKRKHELNCGRVDFLVCALFEFSLRVLSVELGFSGLFALHSEKESDFSVIPAGMVPDAQTRGQLHPRLLH